MWFLTLQIKWSLQIKNWLYLVRFECCLRHFCDGETVANSIWSMQTYLGKTWNLLCATGLCSLSLCVCVWWCVGGVCGYGVCVVCVWWCVCAGEQEGSWLQLQCHHPLNHTTPADFLLCFHCLSSCYKNVPIQYVWP